MVVMVGGVWADMWGVGGEAVVGIHAHEYVGACWQTGDGVAEVIGEKGSGGWGRYVCGDVHRGECVVHGR